MQGRFSLKGGQHCDHLKVSDQHREAPVGSLRDRAQELPDVGLVNGSRALSFFCRILEDFSADSEIGFLGIESCISNVPQS